MPILLLLPHLASPQNTGRYDLWQADSYTGQESTTGGQWDAE